MKNLLFLVVFVFALNLFSCNQDRESTQITKIALRDIGNKLLLSYQDSTSLILPVKKISNGTYELSFQSQLGFNPDSLVLFTKESINKTDLPREYRVEVIQCEDDEVAYSYDMKNDEEKSIIPCSGRELPLKCYTIQLEFPKTNSKFNYLWVILILGVISLIWWLTKPKRQDSLNEKNTHSYKIGNYKFDRDQSKLLYIEKEIGLSKKECELLEILCDNLNEVVKRDELSKRVWEDHGVFVGRSLDTYISKLRKKLKEDASIKITNVHGVGYKLEVTKIK